MPRKAKITAVPVDDQPDLTLKTAVGEVFTHRVADQREPKTEAEQMTDVINEVNVNEVESPVTRAVQIAPEAKAKRVSKKEPVFTEPEVEVTSSLDEVQAEVVMPNQEPYVESKVACPDCGKKMSAKTLKYSHGPNCVIQKQKQSQENEEYAKLSHTAKQVAQETGGEDGANALHAIGLLDSLNNISERDIKHFLQTRTRTERATRREAMVANLMKNAF